MRVKEWHRILVQGRPVYHDLEPVYYRQDKSNARVEGIWYCAQCDDIVDMRRLTRQGFKRKPDLSAVYTSMYEKGLRFEKKPRLSDQAVKKIQTVEPKQDVFPKVGRNDPRSSVSRGSPTPVIVSKVGRNDPCPCGSGKKYKKCHGA